MEFFENLLCNKITFLWECELVSALWCCKYKLYPDLSIFSTIYYKKVLQKVKKEICILNVFFSAKSYSLIASAIKCPPLLNCTTWQSRSRISSNRRMSSSKNQVNSELSDLDPNPPKTCWQPHGNTYLLTWNSIISWGCQ